jgi:hypothetical protein
VELNKRILPLLAQGSQVGEFAAGLSVLLVVSAALLMGQARPFRTVEAERFILRDVSGKRRATLAVAADESVSLTLGDSTGRVRASLSVGKPGASLDFADPNGKVKETFSDEGLIKLSCLWPTLPGSSTHSSGVGLNTTGDTPHRHCIPCFGTSIRRYWPG